MFWTAFVWGIGASMGAAIGVVFLVLMLMGLEWITGKAARATEALGLREAAVFESKRNNELTAEIANCLTFMADAKKQEMRHEQLCHQQHERDIARLRAQLREQWDAANKPKKEDDD